MWPTKKPVPKPNPELEKARERASTIVRDTEERLNRLLERLQARAKERQQSA